MIWLCLGFPWPDGFSNRKMDESSLYPATICGDLWARTFSLMKIMCIPHFPSFHMVQPELFIIFCSYKLVYNLIQIEFEII